MTMVTTGGRADLDARSRAIARSLRDALSPIVQEAIGEDARPATLARSLKIDRTLAARLLRSIHAKDLHLVLREIPSPGGLRIFLNAARRRRLSSELCRAAEDSVQQYERLIHEFPGGRAALDAAISEWSPQIRERTERSAKQAVFKSMSLLLGYQAEVTVSSLILQPSADGSLCDSAHLMIKESLRRIRATVPITAFGRTLYQNQPPGKPASYVETLDGRVQPHSSEPCLLEQFCTRPTPALRVLEQGDLFLYTLDENNPPVNVPVTLASAMVVRNGYLRYEKEGQRYEWEGVVPRIPSRLLVTDIFLRDDVYPGVQPVVTPTLYGLAKGPVREPDDPSFELDEVDLSTPVELLQPDAESLAIPKVPQYAEMVEHVFDRLGWERSRFRVFRCSLQYPVPLVSLTHWLELPPEPLG